jgi:Domain of unknown function (DUF4381)
MNDPLAGLHPLHLPPAVGWWPPAPGWWLLALLCLLAAAAGWWSYRRSALRRVALAELQRIDSAADNTHLAAELNRLLRRVALARFPRDQVAALSGEEWLRFLESQVAGFVSGPGQVLATGPYAPDCRIDRAALLGLAQQWIRRSCRRRA